MLRYKGGTSVAYILVPSARNTLMLRAGSHMLERTLGKNPPWIKVSRRRGKVIQGLRIRHASDGSIDINMEPALSQRQRNANAVNNTQ
jgi:hypothetical protein